MRFSKSLRALMRRARRWRAIHAATELGWLMEVEMTLFLDLDGVLADFDAHIEALFGTPPAELPLGEMWRRAAATPGFFETMPMTADAMELWSFCEPYEPRILTGLPRGTWAEAQKRRWVAQHLGPHVLVVACMS